jgi:hypothetical protein
MNKKSFNKIVASTIITGVVCDQFIHDMLNAPVVAEVVTVDPIVQLRTLLTDESIDVNALLIELGFVAAKAEKAISKNALAVSIIKEEYAKPQVATRKDILARLMNECGMGEAYAGTALQNYRKSNGYVTAK